MVLRSCFILFGLRLFYRVFRILSLFQQFPLNKGKYRKLQIKLAVEFLFRINYYSFIFIYAHKSNYQIDANLTHHICLIYSKEGQMHEEAHFFKNPFHFNCHSNLDAFKSYRFHFMSIIHFEMNVLGDKIEY